MTHLPHAGRQLVFDVVPISSLLTIVGLGNHAYPYHPSRSSICQNLIFIYDQVTVVRQACQEHDFAVVLDALRQGSYGLLHVALAHGFTVEGVDTQGAQSMDEIWERGKRVWKWLQQD